MKKIQLATVFSGIGAPEQALKRMNRPYTTVFACDSGGVEARCDFADELRRIKAMKKTEQKRRYVDGLCRYTTRGINTVMESYLANYKVQSDNFFQDIRLLDGTDFAGQVDLLVGGSPCQGFSSLGKQKGLDDPRSGLFYEFIRIVNEVQPAIFVWENVSHVIMHHKGATWAVIEQAFKDTGYHFTRVVLDAIDYGLPQNRARVYIIGFKDEEAMQRFCVPEPVDLSNRPLKTVQDYLEDTHAEGSVLSGAYGLHAIDDKKGQPGEEAFLAEQMVKFVTGNKGYSPEMINTPVAKTITSNGAIGGTAGITNYVTTDGRLRTLTSRELLRLMGFPDDFKIVVSRNSVAHQAGNSIAVDVLIALLNEIIQAAEWEK